MSINIVGGILQQHYHVMPTQLSQISTSPLKENIFQMLGQVSDERFPEFVKDILTDIEGHILIDITDGPGDEKMDIYTLNKNGERCLTQCKHTINYKKNYNGDDLDLMVAACMRKNCKEAIFVTNSDLTPQGKRLVNDKEYERGQNNPNNLIIVDYWNNVKIWEKIKNHSGILNKWFSGLAQTNAMRAFQFDVAVHRLPETSDFNELDFVETLINRLVDNNVIKRNSDDDKWSTIINGHQIEITLEVEVDSNLGVRYHDPESDNPLSGQPLYVLRFHVNVDDQLAVFAPQSVASEIIVGIFRGILPEISQHEWWHIARGRIITFIYLFDLNEPRRLTLENSNTYVSGPTGEITDESAYCSLPSKEYTKKVEDDDDQDDVYIHNKTGIQVICLYDDELDPVYTYNYQIVQQRQLSGLKNLQFQAIEEVNSRTMARARNFLPSDFVAFTNGKQSLIWAIPKNTSFEVINGINRRLAAIGLTVRNVADTDRDELLEHVATDLPPAINIITSNLKGLSRPIRLDKRIFWLSKKMDFNRRMAIQRSLELMKFKFNYETEAGGFDAMPVGTTRSHTVEVPKLLWDIASFRGSRMLDIAINSQPLEVSIRFRDDSIDSAEALVAKYLTEFNEVYQKIQSLLENFVPQNFNTSIPPNKKRRKKNKKTHRKS